MKKEKILLIGGGGHCKVVVDAIRRAKRHNICGIIDPGLKGKTVLGVRVIGNDGDLPTFFKKGIRSAFISVGSVGDCTARKKIYQSLKKFGFRLPFIIHPKAIVAADVKIGEGSFIAAGAVLNPGVIIGKNVIINTNSSVDHDCQIGDFVHIAPGVTLSGGVQVGQETHIGTGASVIQYLKIRKKSFIPAGSILKK